MAYTVIDKSTDYFNSVLYTGNGTAIGSGGNAITGVGHQPDWVWLKNRNSSGHDHFLFDSVNGVKKFLSSNDTGTLSGADNEYLSVFGSDGFTLGNSDGMNENAITFVSWNWKAGTAFSNDASSTSVGSIDSAGSVSTTSGFSIIKWSGANATSTVAHGLGVAPKVILVKSLANTTTWMVQHAGIGNAKEIYLNNNSASGNSTAWNSTTPTSTVFTVTGGAGDGVNHSGDYIGFCFADVQGFSKVGSYIGNANANGAFVYTGFKPAWILIKSTAAGESWQILDNKRSTFNPADDILMADLANDESAVSGRATDFVSNGFKFRGTEGGTNAAATYIYVAFAENPFVTSSGVPGLAR